MSAEENFHRTGVYEGDYRFHTDCLINIIYPKLKYSPDTKLGHYRDRDNKKDALRTHRREFNRENF